MNKEADEIKMITIRMSVAQHKDLKIAALMADSTLNNYVLDALAVKLEKEAK